MKYRLTLLVVAVWLGSVAQSWAVLANAWHIPDNAVGAIGGNHMRQPEFDIGANTSVTIYSGVQKFGNSYGTANQTGGTLFYKVSTQNF